ncbi:MAG: urease accessory protein UreD [Firmicutes bacterium]|nr:urease accessory protein UreD [Bacillota bacterium]
MDRLWSELTEQVNGQINIVFRRNESGRTYMAKQLWKIPLQILKPHYYDVDGTAVVYSLNPAGGILQHDRLLTQIESEPGTDALFTTPGHNKYYKMDEGCAKVWNRLYVHCGGVLEYLPEHNVPFARSTVFQENEFRVEKGGVLFAADMVTAGRVASGEKFAYDRYMSRTRIFIDGQLALYDRCDLRPEEEDLLGMGLLDGYQTNGSLYVVADGMDPKLKEEINALGRRSAGEAAQESSENASVRLAAGNVRPDLLVIRFLGDGMIEMTDTMQRVWDICRKSILGKPALRLRKEFSGCSE